jgi:sugar lactone lactonase YvrE
MRTPLVLLPVAAVVSLAAVTPAMAAPTPFLAGLSAVHVGPSTVPANGDVNPYGVTVVPATEGRLIRGSVLVSNFNNSQNQQGTGTTIVQVSPGGHATLFATINAATLPGKCPGGVGLTTALTVLPGGFVVVGSLPTRDGTSATAKSGCLIVLDDTGAARETISGGDINGPWDMTSTTLPGGDSALFVTNVLNGTVAAGGAAVDRATVVRLVLHSTHGKAPQVVSSTVIGSRLAERTDPGALVIGPTGVALGADGTTLYVADSIDNRIAGIPDALHRHGSAGTGTTVSQGGSLNDPLGMTLAPNGDILTVNGNDGRIVETTPGGTQVAQRLIDNSTDATGDAAGFGTLFGLAIAPGGNAVVFVDDGTNTLNTLS